MACGIEQGSLLACLWCSLTTMLAGKGEFPQWASHVAGAAHLPGDTERAAEGRIRLASEEEWIPQPERLSQSSGETFIAPALRRQRCSCTQGGMHRPCVWTVTDAHETGLCHQCRPLPGFPGCRCSCVYCDPQSSDSSVFSSSTHSEQSTPEDLPHVPEDWDEPDTDPETSSGEGPGLGRGATDASLAPNSVSC